MGMELVVTFAGEAPTWEAIRQRLASLKLEPALRMIDGLPAFPGEAQEEGWRELRLSLPGGMVTLRREPGRIGCVTWGNADAELRRSQGALAWACADAAGGSVETPGGPQSAAEFRAASGLGG